MKKITIENSSTTTRYTYVHVDGESMFLVIDAAIGETVVSLGREALIVPSRDGLMSLRFDKDEGNYQIYDGKRYIYDTMCQDDVEDAIGTGFRKKHFTFYLREL